MNVNIKDLVDLPKQLFETKVEKIAKKTQGTLIIKEYPLTRHMQDTLNRLTNYLLRRVFRPILFSLIISTFVLQVDLKVLSLIHTPLSKTIAEEARGLAVKCNVPIVSATQTTRSGYGNSDVELTDTSESFGLPATADLMFALISTEELEEMNQIMVKQLKNRYNDLNMNKRFVVGIDRAKMRLYNVEASAQGNIIDSGRDSETMESLDNKIRNFEGFKV